MCELHNDWLTQSPGRTRRDPEWSVARKLAAAAPTVRNSWKKMGPGNIGDSADLEGKRDFCQMKNRGRLALAGRGEAALNPAGHGIPRSLFGTAGSSPTSCQMSSKPGSSLALIPCGHFPKMT